MDLQTIFLHSYSQMSHVPYSFSSYKQGKLSVFLETLRFCTFRWDNYETPPLSFLPKHPQSASFRVSCCHTAAVSSPQGGFISVKGEIIPVKEISTLSSPVACGLSSEWWQQAAVSEVGKLSLACKTPWDPVG